MGGFSDVRVQLLAEEREPRQQPYVSSAPVGLGRVGLMLHRWRTRRALLLLDDGQLRDIGLSWQQAREEGRKPFWKP